MSPKLVDLRKAELDGRASGAWRKFHPNSASNAKKIIIVLCCCLVIHCYLDGAFMTGIKEDRSCFWPLTGRRKHTNKNLYNAPVRLCRVRN